MPETATQALHRLTSFGARWWEAERHRSPLEWTAPVEGPRVLKDFVPNDLQRFPWFYKRYPGTLPLVDLPRALPPTRAPAIVVLAGTADVGDGELDLSHLGRLLHLSAGVTRTSQRPHGTYLFRASPSAGGRFPLEVYVAVPEGSSLPAGVHWYHPLEHALVRIGPAPRGDDAVVVVTGVPWRTGWRYRERGYRHVYWDAGGMLAQLLAAADSAGIGARLHTRFPDRSVAALVGADGVHEWPVAVVALGEGRPALEATGAPAAGAVDAAPVEFPLVTSAQRAGESDTLGPAWDRAAPVDVPVGDERPTETVVLARGSQRLMDPTRGLPATVLDTAMSVAMRGIDLPHRVVVNQVDGRAAGVYRWPDLRAPVRPGDLRRELWRVCAEQGLCHDAAFVVIAAADVGELDARGYRDAHLAAGLVMGRLHLAAYALGASASGMTFLDSEVPALLGESLDGLLFTCVGVPEYRSAAGGPPGSPTSIRMISPRE